jgi:hypothetical protein
MHLYSGHGSSTYLSPKIFAPNSLLSQGQHSQIIDIRFTGGHAIKFHQTPFQIQIFRRGFFAVALLLLKKRLNRPSNIGLPYIWRESRMFLESILLRFIFPEFLLFLNHSWFLENTLVDRLNIGRGTHLEWLVDTLSMRSLLTVIGVYFTMPTVPTSENYHSTTSNWKDSVVIGSVIAPNSLLSYLCSVKPKSFVTPSDFSSSFLTWLVTYRAKRYATL